MVTTATKLRCLLLGRKAITNLDSILKSRDITLTTKVCIVKAMVFLVVMYGCNSWTIKKSKCWRTDTFELWCYLVSGSGGYSSWRCMCFSLQWLLLLQSTGFSRAALGYHSCGSRSLEDGISSGGAWVLVALRLVESSRTKDQTHVPCIGRRILNHWITREVQVCECLYW